MPWRYLDIWEETQREDIKKIIDLFDCIELPKGKPMGRSYGKRRHKAFKFDVLNLLVGLRTGRKSGGGGIGRHRENLDVGCG